jgi:hypothetical protein
VESIDADCDWPACVLIQSIGVVWNLSKTVNAIASKKHDAITEYMLAQAVLSEMDLAKNERRAKSTSAGGVR